MRGGGVVPDTLCGRHAEVVVAGYSTTRIAHSGIRLRINAKKTKSYIIVFSRWKMCEPIFDHTYHPCQI